MSTIDDRQAELERSERVRKRAGHRQRPTSATGPDRAGSRRRPASTQHDTRQRLRGFRPEIEGLRAVAVMLVVLFHAGVTQLPGGFVGVDVFFVISGFLITRLLLAERVFDGRISFGDFYLRRARRLLPALALVIVTTLVLSRFLSAPLVTSRVAVDSIWASAYATNIRFLVVGLDYFNLELEPSPLLHLWSLAVEEQFYLLWPVTMVLLMAGGAAGTVRMRRPIVATSALLLASLAACVVVTRELEVVAYFLPFTRIWELLAGALLAFALLGRHRIHPVVAAVGAWVGIAGIIASAVLITEATPFPGSAAVLPVVGTMLVIACSSRGGSVRWLLSRPSMQSVGGISYSLYLWHWPLLVLAGTVLERSISPVFGLPVVGLSMLLAAATYRYVENPIRRSRTLRASPRRSVVLAVLLTIIPVLVALVLLASQPRLGDGSRPDIHISDRLRDDPVALARASAGTTYVPGNMTPEFDDVRSDDTTVFTDGCHLPSRSDLDDSPACEYGDVTSNTTVIAFGDSHMSHWFPPLESIAKRNGWRLVMLVRGGCPSMDIIHGQACKRWRDNSVWRIIEEQPAMVILSNHWCRDCAGKQGSVIERIQAESPDSRIVVLEDTPSRELFQPHCVSKHLDDVQECADSRETVEQQGDPEMKRVVETHDATWVDTTDWLCAEEVCPPFLGNVLVTMDQTHLTVPAAMLLERPLDVALTSSIR